MCGINLIIDKYKRLAPDIISKMADSNQHRGPDHTASQIILAQKCDFHLASNQLKISDLSDHSSQPFFSKDRKLALLYNGEIYNYYELKNILIGKGISFHTHSDTEVLFHWLKLYGASGIAKLEGMFAFAFIDLENSEVILSRDRFGIKPLYYCEDKDYVIVSSEIKSILCTGLVVKKVNELQVRNYLLYKYVKSPETIFEGIYALEPGAILHWKNGTWNTSEIPVHESSHRSFQSRIPDVNEVESLITNSLLRQLNAKVPIGLLLSGGVDSTLLLALARKEGFTIPTFSIINNRSEAAYGTNDFQYSKLAAKIYESEHHEIEVDINILNEFDQFIDQLDQPIGDSSQLMTSEVCRFASGHSKILLSGAGADELFAGYNRHYAFFKYLSHQKMIRTTLPLISPLIRLLPSGGSFGVRKKIRLLKKLTESLDPSVRQTYYNFLTFNELGIDIPIEVTSNENDWLAWALQHDLNNYLVDDVLALSDQASMRHSIELRVPYLDENLLGYLNRFPAEVRLKFGRKWILKQILKKYDGKKFVSRAKEGFGLPVSAWLLDKQTKYLWEPFHSENALIYNFLDKSKFDWLIEQQKNRSREHGPLLWSILVLGHWLERNFE